MNFRIGHGYDVHRLVAGRRLIIGGVENEGGGAVRIYVIFYAGKGELLLGGHLCGP